jgi:putative nucleotidyltransferase-like protein
MTAASAAIRPKPTTAGRSRPELELLLAACSGPLSKQRLQKCEEWLDQPLDWEFLLNFAEQHDLAALFFWNAQSFAGALPSSVVSRLRFCYEHNARKNLLLTQLLMEVYQLLHRAAIASIALKGPTLAAGIYGDLGLRQFSDVDLLVRRSDIPRAKELLLAAGFQSALQLTSTQERLHLRWDNEFPFHRGAQENILELQWRITPYFYAVDFDLEGQFERATSTGLGGIQCPTLCPEDMLLVLCVHGAKHAWTKLSWLCDIAWLVRTHHLNWDQIEHDAESLGIERILFVSLALTQHFYRTPLPQFAQVSIEEDCEVRLLAEGIAARIVDEQPLDISSPGYFFLMWRLRERWRDRMRLLSRLVFTPGPGEWTAVSLPAMLSPAYLVIRGCRLGAKMVRHVFHLKEKR